MKTRTAALVLASPAARSRSTPSLARCAGLSLVSHAVKLALARHCDPVVVVVDHEPSDVAAVVGQDLPHAAVLFTVAKKPSSSIEAALAGLAALGRFQGRVLVLEGDTPLLSLQSLARLERAQQRAALALLSAEVASADGGGPAATDGGRVLAFVEPPDGRSRERSVHEIPAGAYLCSVALLQRVLRERPGKNGRGRQISDLVRLA